MIVVITLKLSMVKKDNKKKKNLKLYISFICRYRLYYINVSKVIFIWISTST